MTEQIKDIKLITHNAGGVRESDDPSCPWRLDATFRPPEFMNVAFVLLHGGAEVVCVRGKTREALEQFIDLNGLRTHPRLISLEITQPEAELEEADQEIGQG